MSIPIHICKDRSLSALVAITALVQGSALRYFHTKQWCHHVEKPIQYPYLHPRPYRLQIQNMHHLHLLLYRVQEGSASIILIPCNGIILSRSRNNIHNSISVHICCIDLIIGPSALVAISEAVKETVPPPDIATLVTTPVIEIVGVAVMVSLNVAVIVTVSDALRPYH